MATGTYGTMRQRFEQEVQAEKAQANLQDVKIADLLLACERAAGAQHAYGADSQIFELEIQVGRLQYGSMLVRRGR